MKLNNRKDTWENNEETKTTKIKIKGIKKHKKIVSGLKVFFVEKEK